jgi:transcriptional antiterminator NusG
MEVEEVVHPHLLGYERKVAESLMNRIQAYDLGECIGQILIPTEDVVETKSGKKIVTTKLTFPGYILVEMDMTDKAWHIVRGTPKVTGFISTGKKPTPLRRKRSMSGQPGGDGGTAKPVTCAG